MARAVLFLLLAPAAWLFPPHRWPALSRMVSRGWSKIRTFEDSQLRTIVAETIGRHELAIQPAEVWERTLANNVEFMLQLLRMSLPRLSRWQPDVELVGREHIEESLRQGHGVILWVHRFRPLIHLVALHQAGFDVCRPSGRHHGEFFRSRLGRNWLNPLQNAIENRFCRRVIVRDHSFGHLRELQQHLRRPGVVCMYADQFENTRNIEVPFLARRLSFSTQATSLALQTNSHVLSVFSVAQGPGRFRVIVEPGLDFVGQNRAAADDAVARHAQRLESYVLRYPDEWQSWGRLRPATAPR